MTGRVEQLNGAAAVGQEESATEERHRILHRVQAAIQLRMQWLRHLLEEEIESRGEGTARRLALLDTPEKQAGWQDSQCEDEQLRALDRRVVGEATGRLVECFGLNDVDIDVLHWCAAMELAPGLAQAVAALTSVTAKTESTQSLVGRCFGHGRAPILAPGSPLKSWKMVRPDDRRRGDKLRCDPTLLHWLGGQIEPPEQLVGIVEEIRQRRPLKSWPVEAIADVIERQIRGSSARGVRVVVKGAAGSGRSTFCEAVCRRLDREARRVDGSEVDDPETRRLVERQARAEGFVAVWDGEPAVPPAAIEAPAVQFLVVEPTQTVESRERCIDHVVEMPPLTYGQRQQLWNELVPVAKTWDQSQLDHLASRNAVQIGDIAAVGEVGVTSAAEAIDYLGARIDRPLGDLAHRLDCPFRRDDLIVPKAVGEKLDELVFEAGDRASLMAREQTRRLFPYGRGLVALFHGPPGTGKTMAAQITARRLQLNLYRVDLSTMVSKYIGETMSQVRELLDRASRLDAVLFFDEADALFGQRTEVRDARDRYANTDTNFLLQALESYDGVALLASNRRHQLDDAFTRRFRHIVEFKRPDEPERQQLWQRLIDQLWPADTDATVRRAMDVLAADVKLTGAQIKSSILTAIFRARRRNGELSATDLVEGVSQEMSKSGSGLSGRKRQALRKAIGL